MTSSRNLLLIAFLLLACLSCKVDTKKNTSSETQKDSPTVDLPQDSLTVDLLLDRLTNDSLVLQQIRNEYPERMWKDFRWCDSMLQYVPEQQIRVFFDTLNLTQAYLSQFEEMLPGMQDGISYSRQQLTSLKNDIDTQFISDSLATIYLKDENAAIEILHNRILYFQDRFSRQDKALSHTKESIRKAAKQ